jgi:hypothetical protein
MAVFDEVDEAEVESAGPVQGPTSDDEAERKADDASLDEPYEPEYDLVRAQEAKVVGNDRYAASEWQLASDAYTEAIMWAPPDAEVRARARARTVRHSRGAPAPPRPPAPRAPTRRPPPRRVLARARSRAGARGLLLQPRRVLHQDGRARGGR